jgi:hypothetical protein
MRCLFGRVGQDECAGLCAHAGTPPILAQHGNVPNLKWVSSIALDKIRYTMLD